MNDKNVLSVLKIIISKLKEPFLWRMEGSGNLLIQGIDTPVNDFDITTTKEGLEIFKEALKEFSPIKFYNAEKKTHSVTCKIQDFEIEINFYDNSELNMLDRIKIIEWNGLKIPTLPLSYAKEFYEKIGRTQKVELIKKYLK